VTQVENERTSVSEQDTFDWRAEYTYAVGLQAFIYGFPYVYMAQVRHMWTTQPRNPAFVPYMAVNHFRHASQVLTANYQDGGQCFSSMSLEEMGPRLWL
jgi:hypothetical protein